MKKKLLSMLLCAVMLCGLIPQGLTAASVAADDGLCEHHTEHTEDCGYVEADEGSPCAYVCPICSETELNGEAEDTELSEEEQAAALEERIDDFLSEYRPALESESEDLDALENMREDIFAAYEELSPEAQALVSNYDDFIDAINGTAVLAEARAAYASSATITDEENGATFTYSLSGTNATLTAMTEPTEEAEIIIPRTITYNGTEYTVTSINMNSMSTIYNVAEITLPDTLTSISGTFWMRPLKELTIPGSVKTFSATLNGCQGMETLTFEEGVEAIDAGSYAMLYNTPNLTTVNLPSTLKKLGSSTFTNATGLKTITLPEGLEELGTTFSGCTALTEITLPSKITEISSNAFSECTALETVKAEGTITSIGKYAFSSCTSLTTVPDLSNVTEMGADAFYKCYALGFADGTLNISSLKEIPKEAFMYCYGIQKVIFSDELESIGQAAFVYCTYLKTGLPESRSENTDNENVLIFPETLITIKNNAFKNVGTAYTEENIPEKVYIPNSVTTIEVSSSTGSAFYGINATEIYIGDENGIGVSGVSEIATYTFYSCSKLEKLTINNTEDDVSFPPLLTVPDGTKVIWLQKSIAADIGDTISDETDAPTLQQAVNAAGEGDTITISKDIRLSNALNIPADKEITIRSSGDEPFTILGSKDGTLSDLITVAAGADVTFENITLSGAYNTGSVIEVKGSAKLSDGAVVEKSIIATNNTGVIQVDGENAEFTMLDGSTVQNNKIQSVLSGSILVANGGTAYIKGGTIRNNKVSLSGIQYTSSPGIMLYGDSRCEMTGGTITGNTSIRGSAVMLYSNGTENKTGYTASDGTSTEQYANFTMSGGTITGNTCERMNSVDVGGTVQVEGASSFTMTGGTISANTTSGYGGGVCVLDNALNVNYTASSEFGTEFIMYGGEISENKAYAGGGIYSFSNNVYLYAGTISENTATNMGGGVYVEGNTTNYSTLHMENAVITENESGDQGGGLWFCTTGSGAAYATNGGAVYGNTAVETDWTGAGDDVAFAASTNGKTLTLAGRALGGGQVLYYHDGAVAALTGDNSIYPSTMPSSERYNEDEPGESISVVDNASNLAVHAVMSEEAIALAKENAELYITGNTATWYGGGVAANGGVEIGEPDDWTLKVSKTWNAEDEALKQAVTVYLKIGGYVLDPIELNEDNGWTGSFTGLPNVKTLNGTVSYAVVEDSVPDGFTPEYSEAVADEENKTITINITNTYSPTTGGEGEGEGEGGGSDLPSSAEITIRAKMALDGETPPDGEFTFVLRDKSGNIIQTVKNNGSDIVFNSLSFSETGTYEYTITEIRGTDDGIVYDTTVYTMIVEVTKSGDYHAEVTYFKDGEKYDSTPLFVSSTTADENSVNVSVSKIWNDNDSADRPTEVTVQLNMDGEKCETVVLNSDNGWQYTWIGLDKGYEWTVEEDGELDGYTSKISREGNVWTITNTSNDNPDNPNNPHVPDEPDNPDNPDNPDDHVAYIIGYEDGTVRPQNSITRAEVATIFFRLLTDESRALYWGKTNSFSDVSDDDWFNNAVSTMFNAGIISGYPDGTFKPNAPITRAEFATIAARFSEVIYNGGNSFTDVPENHWAAQYIALAEYLGWINGYEDGTFRPDQSITRAEAMTLINRVLERAVEEEHMLPDMVTWNDNVPGAWYYEDVQEATNSHEYTRLNRKATGQSFYYEDWREILKVPDWAALERVWSTANSK